MKIHLNSTLDLQKMNDVTDDDGRTKTKSPVSSENINTVAKNITVSSGHGEENSEGPHINSR